MLRRPARLACLALGVMAIALPAIAQASPPIDVRGTYVVTSQVGDPSPDNTMVVETENCDSGALAGHGFGNGYTWSLTGTISDAQITYHADYHEISYSSDFAGTVTSDGNRETGTFHDSGNGSGSFDFTRTAPGPSDGGCGRPSATKVACDTENPGQPNEDFLCTATVADASTINPPVTPTGTVTFALDPGAGGTFASGPTCTLAASPSGSTAFCARTYQPGSQAVPTGSQPPLSATYDGDSTFTPSSGRPQNGTAGPPGPEPTAEPTPDPTATPCAPTPPPNRVFTDGPFRGLRQLGGGIGAGGGGGLAYCKGVRYTDAQKAAAKAFLASLSMDTALRRSYVAGLGPTPGNEPGPEMKAFFDALVPMLLAIEAQQKQDMQLIVADPPDPAWRTIARPPHVHAVRIRKSSGLGRRERVALERYERSLLRSVAALACVNAAINRGSTALSHGDEATARRQYQAGATCATAESALAAGRATLVRRAGSAIKRIEAFRRSKAARRVVRHGLHASAAKRRATARHVCATLRRLVRLPSADIRKLRRSLAKAPRKDAADRPLPGLLRDLARLDTAQATIQRDSAASLQAAGA